MWNCCRSVNADKLEKIQRRAASVIIGLGSSDKALEYLGYVTLAKRRDRRTLNLVKNWQALFTVFYSSRLYVYVILLF